MDLYKVYNLLTLYPGLKIQFKYELEGEYLAISKDGLYTTIPTAWDVRIHLTTERYICLMNQVLYPVEKIEWCLYTIFEQEKENIKQYCTIDTTEQHANMAQSLDGYLWAVSPIKNEKMQIRCLTESTVTDIKPPLTLIFLGNGCEAYSSNLYIPAKSEQTSQDDSLTWHDFYSEFSNDYQNISQYSMIENLHLEQLTPEELAKLPNRLAAISPLKYQHLMEQIKPINETYPFSIHPNILLAMLLGMGVMVFGFNDLCSLEDLSGKVLNKRFQAHDPVVPNGQSGKFLTTKLKNNP